MPPPSRELGLQEYEPVPGGDAAVQNVPSERMPANLVPPVDDYGGLAKVVPDTQDLPELQSDDISPSKPPLHDGIIGRHSILHTSSIMVLLLLLGLASALGHHAFNAHLVGHAVDSDLSFGGWFNVPSQTLVFRVATAFVFLTKTFFTSAVSMAFTQRLWVTVSRKYLRLSGLDALWAVLNDPLAFATWDMLRNAKMLTLLALVAWLIPLASIPAPSALTAVPSNTSAFAPCMIPAVDLMNSNATEFQYYAEIDSLGFYYATSPIVQTIAVQTLSSGSYTTWPSPCGPNCNYNTSYWAPWYNCSPEQPFGIDHVEKWIASDNPSLTQDNLTIVWLSAPFGEELNQTTCYAWNATYDISVSYSDGVQLVVVDHVEPRGPIATDQLKADGGQPLGRNVPGVTNSAGVKDAFATLLAGYLSFGPSSLYNVNATMVGFSALAEYNGSAESIYFPDVPSGVQSLMQNFSVSLMAHSPVPSVAATCQVSGTQVIWQYHPAPLWAAYGSILGVAVVAVCVGLSSMLTLGGAGSRAFSLLVATTRNGELDAVFGAARGEFEQKSLMRERYSIMDDRQAQFAFRVKRKHSSTLAGNGKE
ncbi:hypothetical protein BKA93DRAFT_826456 [Sparassis latifolia]